MSNPIANECAKYIIPIKEWAKHDGKVPQEIQEVIDEQRNYLRLVEMYGNPVALAKHPKYGWVLLEAGPCIIWIEGK